MAALEGLDGILMKSMILTACLMAVLPALAQDDTPRLQVDAEDVVSTHTVRSGNREVTFQKIRPLSLPPIPEPEAKEPLTEAQLEELRNSIPEELLTRRHVFVGASAYVVRDEEGNERYYSRVRYWLDYQGGAVEFWTNANFIWLSGQMCDFKVGNQVFSLMLASSVMDVDKMELLAARKQQGETEWAPSIPDFPEFEDAAASSIQVVEGNPSEENLAPIRALLSYYDENKLRLKVAYEDRKAAYEERRLQRLANPPEEKDVIIRYFRLDQPAEKAAVIR